MKSLQLSAYYTVCKSCFWACVHQAAMQPVMRLTRSWSSVHVSSVVDLQPSSLSGKQTQAVSAIDSHRGTASEFCIHDGTMDLLLIH